MKNSDFSRIKSYKELQAVRIGIDKDIERLKCDISRHAGLLTVSLSPKSLMNEVLQWVSPLFELYRRFCR